MIRFFETVLLIYNSAFFISPQILQKKSPLVCSIAKTSFNKDDLLIFTIHQLYAEA